MSKINKVLLTAFFTFLLTLCLFISKSVDAVSIPDINVESKTVHRGQTFSIDVDLTNNEGLISLYLTLDYDNSVMQLIDCERKDGLGSLTFTTTNTQTEQGYSIKPFNLLWDGKDVDKSNGTLVTLIFESYIDAAIGEYPITITYDKENTNVAYKTPTDVNITNGVVELIAGEYRAIYRDYDGKVLYDRDYNGDEVPSYPDNLELPFREEDKEYSYEFVGWKGAVSDDINVLIFEANYILTPQKYTVFLYVDGANGYPDNVIDENDFFKAFELPFGTIIELPEVPRRQYYQFYGWYSDEGFTETATYSTMPTNDIRLYGYYSFEVRENNIPIISLEDVTVSEGYKEVTVIAELLKNTGFNGMVLTLKYDKNIFEFDSYTRLDTLATMQFDTSNLENSDLEDLKFYYESATNNYETGKFLELHFKVKDNVEPGTYEIYFDYDYHRDATYINAANEIKYTKIDFYKGFVPVGEINYWEKALDDVRGIEVKSADGKPINVYLEFELVTDKVHIEQESINVSAGDDMYASSVYSIKLMQNKKVIPPNTILTISIKLTDSEQAGNLKFYYLNDNGELIEHDFEIIDGKLVFQTDHLSYWVIFNNKTVTTTRTINTLFLVGMPIILAIATMLYALRMKQIARNKKEGEL